MASLPASDLLQLDAGHFQDLFNNRTITITSLVCRIVQQIKNENRNGLALGAIISMAPESLLQNRADYLDRELRSGRSLGRLHGIPIVLKVQSDPWFER
jgi:amidase